MSKAEFPPAPWTIEHRPGGQVMALYSGRTDSTHGLNLIHLSEPSHQWPQVKPLIEAAPELYGKLIKVHDWLITLAEQAEDQAKSYSRFESLADATRRDAKNYRRTAADIATALAKARGEAT